MIFGRLACLTCIDAIPTTTALRAFIRRAVPNCPGSRYLPARANAQAAVAAYNWEPEADCYLPAAVIVFTFEGAQVKDMTSFATPKIFSRFDLPAQLPAR